MIINRIDDLENIPEVTIIGGGVSAISAAITLEKLNITSLIIEAGPIGPNIDELSQSFYNGKTTKDEYFDLKETRVRKFGGSSEHWEDQVTLRPLDKYDFKGWLFTKDELDKYTEEAAKIFDVNNNFSNRDIKISENIQITKFIYGLPKTKGRHEEIHFGKKFLDHIKNSKKIHLVGDTRVLSLDGENKVEKIYYIKDNVKNELTPNITIMATGGIENSRILLYSQKISKKNFLKNIKIGTNWMEHITGLVIGSFVGNHEKLENLISCFNKELDYNNTYLSFTNSTLNRLNCLNILLKFQKNKLSHKIFYYLKVFFQNFNLIFDPVLKIFNFNFPSNIKLIAMIEQKPNEDNFIKLSENLKDPHFVPEPELNWNWKNQKEIKDSLNISINELNFFLKKNKIGKIIPQNFLRNFDTNYPADSIYAGHHHLGGTQMSDKPENGVVDKNLKVFNLSNLFITGGSVFPTGGYVHPTFTIVQLSIRLAHHIEKNYIIDAKKN